MAKKKAPTRPEGTITLTQLADAYVADLERCGKSQGTIMSYRLELALVMAELGNDLPIDALTPERVATFNECSRVMQTKSGHPKSPPTFLKTRRVFRQALQFAEAAKWLEKAPLPDQQAVAG